MNEPVDNSTCWIVTEGIAGTENQCIGIAEKLGLSPGVKRIGLRWPWSILSPWLGFERACTFSPKPEPPWPDILIASGRKSIAVSRYIKRKSRGKTFTVQVQDPRINPSAFDLVAVPGHDSLRGDNVLVTTATPNRISAEKLETAKSRFNHFSKIRKPRVAVLIGGNSKKYRIDADFMRKLAEDLVRLDAGLMVTASRRTGEEAGKALYDSLQNAGAFYWDGKGDNPYFGFLAWADYIFVTSDSASMLSEAASTGKPVYMIELPGGSEKFGRLHENLIRHGAVRRFKGELEKAWNYEPLDDAGIVAGKIREALKQVRTGPQ